MSIPAVCIAGWANAGKTTLIERLLPELHARGLHVAVVKHSHHPLTMDAPGTDTARYRAVGAAQVVLAAPDATAAIVSGCVRLADILQSLHGIDLILVEGFDKEAEMPTLEVWRDANAPMRSSPAYRCAVVTDLPYDGSLPHFSPNNIGGIADMLLNMMHPTEEQFAIFLSGRRVALSPEDQKRVAKLLKELLVRR